jgi:hypothetical protein
MGIERDRQEAGDGLSASAVEDQAPFKDEHPGGRTDTDDRDGPNEHPLEGGQTDAVDEAQEVAGAGSSASAESSSFLIRFPDGTGTLETVDDNGAYPKRGDEVAPGWIVDEVEIRDGRDDDVMVGGQIVYLEARVVSRDEFVA